MAAGARRDAWSQAAAARPALAGEDSRGQTHGRIDDREPGRVQHQGAAGIGLVAEVSFLADGFRRSHRFHEWRLRDEMAGRHQALPVIAADLDQVAVRVAEIDGCHRTEGAVAPDRSELDGNHALHQARDDLVDRPKGVQAKIAGPWRWPFRLGLEGPIDLMHIDLLLAELERRRRAGTHLAIKPQHPFIEGQRRFDRADGEDDVVKTVDQGMPLPSRGVRAETLTFYE